MKRFENVLVASDLDGTLLDSRKNVGEKTRRAIEFFMDNGGRFTVSTGRLVASFLMLKDKLCWNAPLILANGCQIYDFAAERTLAACYLPRDCRPAMQAILDDFPGTCLEAYSHMACDMVRPNAVSRAHAESFGFGFMARANAADLPDKVFKTLFTNDHETLCRIRERVERDLPQLNVMFSSEVFLEVFSGETDKGRGTLKLASLLGIPPERVYAVGDQENDLTLLRAAGVSYAPANSVPAVLAEADVVLPDNDHDAVAALIEDLCTRYPDR
ncbi:MAG: HAD family hydrolase [Oscillospiraceae bacterium]|nr:HAD family hydrolase [Oscillospiraceae bacterium]